MISSSELTTCLGQVADALDLPAGGGTDLAAVTQRFVRANLTPTAQSTYLLIAVLTGVIPTAAEVVRQTRRWRLDGVAVTIAEVVTLAKRTHRLSSPSTVRIESGYIVDVHDTAHTAFTTGIQRVVRSVLPIWAAGHPLVLVGWDDAFTAPRTLTAAEYTLAVGAEAGTAPTVPSAPEIVVPYRATLILPEIAVDQRRATRLHAIARHSGSRSVAVGHDCIPITTAETAGGGMPGGFSRYLSALAAFDVIAATSGASAAEFGGWKTMLHGAGIEGPEIAVVGLPGTPSSRIIPEPADLLRGRLGIPDGSPILLSVGSHEPRKNHLALLQAAELVWRQGIDFTLVMVGGNSWDTAAFDRTVADLRARGRRVLTPAGVTDAAVWGLYRAAEFTLFPSVNEGFGLPVVESIANGTPVITSNFGSMSELAEGHGGVLVDPRDEEALAAAMVRLLTDPASLAELREQTRTAPSRSWDEYAHELWDVFGVGRA